MQPKLHPILRNYCKPGYHAPDDLCANTEKQNLKESFLRNFIKQQLDLSNPKPSNALTLDYTAGTLLPDLQSQLHSLQERSSVWSLLQVVPGLSTPDNSNVNFIISTRGKTSLRKILPHIALADSVALSGLSLYLKQGSRRRRPRLLYLNTV